MLTLAVVLALSVALGLACALLVRRGLRSRPRWLRRGAAGLTTLVVAVASVEGWAHVMVDRSGIARAVAWLEADTGDLERFPARRIAAGDQPLRLERCSTQVEASEIEVDVAGARTSLADVLDDTGTTSFLALSDRCLLEERYGDGSAPDDLQTSFSMAKSFLSTLVGIAIERREIGGLDDPITDYLPELVERDARFERITLRHLVTMTSGLHYEEQGLPWSDDAVTYYSPDLRETALSVTVDEAPGERWLYNNYNPLLMGMILERATGSTVAGYMERHLWQPMGADHDASWSLDSTRSGFEKMESGLNAVPRDYARFGYLFAHEGRVASRQVVPAAWVAEATAEDISRDPEPGYQHWWWVDEEREDRFIASGNHGQFIYVDARTDLVLVRTGARLGSPDWVDVLRQVADQLSEGEGPPR